MSGARRTSSLRAAVTFFIDAQGVVVASFAGPLDQQTIDHYLGW